MVRGTNYNPWLAGDEADYQPPGPPKIRYSLTELFHLGSAVFILTAAFTLVLNSPSFAAVEEADLAWWQVLLAAFGAVTSGFVLHELAHKIVAQRYGHWAEFRAQFAGLGITLLLAALLKALFAAPGAVVIYGRVTPKENGLISLVGPGINFVIALAAYPFTLVTDTSAALPTILYVVAFVNALLAVFNLIPFGPFDGRKVLSWNWIVWLVSMVLCATLLVLVWVGIP
ncbi:MAG: M50 family metallopeptidase [Thermoplasmatota archaeon]